MDKRFYKNETIRELREQRSLTQEEFARLINTTPQTVSRIETGVCCSFVTLVKCAGALEVPWFRLLRIEADEEISAAA
jgi:transcriptional regulator with XRE-family HTH domain